MKNLIAIIAFVIISVTSFSQCPGGMFYQAQITDTEGVPVPDSTAVSVTVTFVTDDSNNIDLGPYSGYTDGSVYTTYIVV